MANANKGLSASEKKEIESDNDDAATNGEGKKKKPLGIIIAVVLLLLGGAGAGLYFSGMLPIGKTQTTQDAPADSKDTAAEHGEKAASSEHGEASGEHGEKVEGAKASSEVKGPIIFTFPETPQGPANFTANLNTGGKQPVFLNVEVAFEVPTLADKEALGANLPRIQDMFNTYLRELRPSDLQGSAGIYRLREELLLRVNKAIAPAKVSDVLFKKIIVQ